MKWIRSALCALSAAGMAAAGSLHGRALAQEFPNRPIMVSLAAGKITDVPAGAYAEALSRNIGQPVIVENPAGAGGGIAAAAGADDRRRLDEYIRARRAYEEQASAYWIAIADKRRARFAKRRNGERVTLDDYVLVQPPVYSGPPRPPGPPPDIPQIAPPRKYIPVAADFLKAALEHFGFVPHRPESELEMKRAYARAAAAVGLTRDQVVRIYGFESGGNGRYDVQAGLEYGRPGARAITTALGYNQLLTTNTISLLAEHGDHIVKALKTRPADGAGGNIPEAKIKALVRMIEFSRTVPVKWSEHEKLADTPQGWALHALVFDKHIGPLLQTQKLVNSINFARMKGHKSALTAAELEMMNLTGDGNGIDIVTMPAAMREAVPTSNFFQRNGYERNPVAIRNNTVARLLAATDAKMDKETKAQGALDLAAAYDAAAAGISRRLTVR